MELNRFKSDFAYNKIENAIVFQALEPGSMLSEKALAEDLALGRTPVREALQRLAYEGMVEIHPRRGIQIPMISVETQLKILEVRRGIEELCIRFATSRATTEQKQQMLKRTSQLEECAAAQDDQRYAVLLKDIHQVLLQATNNEYIQLAMLPLQGLSRRFWFANKDEKDDLLQAARCHADILRAVCHTDVEEAALASHRLNDYLTEMAYRSLKGKVASLGQGEC